MTTAHALNLLLSSIPNDPQIIMGYYTNFMLWHIVAPTQRALTTQTISDYTLPVSEETHDVPTTFNKAYKLIVVLKFEQSNITLFGKRHFQLIVNFCAQCLGAQDSTADFTDNSKLIVGFRYSNISLIL
jgi:hypothetical protein